MAPSPRVLSIALRILPVVLVVVGGVLLTGCASKFDRAWARAPRPDGADPFQGRWDGKWVSKKHQGHSGRLRAVLEPAGPDRYTAYFKANWMIFVSSYTVPLQSRRRGGDLEIRGEHDLGKLFGGVYRYRGRVTPSDFRAEYDSSYDTGTFELQR